MFEGLKADLLDFDRQLSAADMRPGVVTMQIDGLRYTNEKLPATRANDVWPRLGRLLGAAGLRRVATGDGPLDFASMLANTSAVAMNDGLNPLISELLSRMRVDRYRHMPVTPGQTGAVMAQFDEHFKGEYLHMLKVCGFAIAHNLRGPTLGSPLTSGSRTTTNEATAPTKESTSETSPT